MFHVELFAASGPRHDSPAEQMAELRDGVRAVEWKVHDVVIAPVPEIPLEQVPVGD